MKYEPDLAELVSFSDKKALNKAYNFLFKSVRLIINKINHFSVNNLTLKCPKTSQEILTLKCPKTSQEILILPLAKLIFLLVRQINKLTL